MSKEQSKAMKRRKREIAAHGADPESPAVRRYPIWDQIFCGNVLDIGCGDDPVRKEYWPNITRVTTFDRPGSGADIEGDANQPLHVTCAKHGPFDCIHASHVLEHLHHPRIVLRNWLGWLEPGGHVVAFVPDFDLYELGIWPSAFGHGHVTRWSCWRRDVEGYMPALRRFILEGVPAAESFTYRLITTNYDWMNRETDQTANPADGVECGIEMVIKVRNVE